MSGPTLTTCRECSREFQRAPGTPRVCEPCLPAFKQRLMREGTPVGVYRYPAEVLGDPAHVKAVLRLARRAARFTVASTSSDPLQGCPYDPAEIPLNFI